MPFMQHCRRHSDNVDTVHLDFGTTSTVDPIAVPEIEVAGRDALIIHVEYQLRLGCSRERIRGRGRLCFEFSRNKINLYSVSGISVDHRTESMLARPGAARNKETPQQRRRKEAAAEETPDEVRSRAASWATASSTNLMRSRSFHFQVVRRLQRLPPNKKCADCPSKVSLLGLLGSLWLLVEGM